MLTLSHNANLDTNLKYTRFKGFGRPSGSQVLWGGRPNALRAVVTETRVLSCTDSTQLNGFSSENVFVTCYRHVSMDRCARLQTVRERESDVAVRRLAGDRQAHRHCCTVRGRRRFQCNCVSATSTKQS